MAIAKLSIDFEARLGQFETEIKRISSVADGVSSKLTNAFKGLGLAMAGIGAGVGLNTLKEKFDSVVESAAKLKQMSEATGASVENLSGLGAVAKITATDMGLVETAMNKLSKGLHASDEDAKGVGKALAFLGLKLEDLRGKDPAANFKTLADALNKVDDGTGKTALGMAILGKQYTAVAAYLKDLAENGDLVTKTTTEQAEAAKAYEQDLKRLQLTKDALYKTVSLALVPAFDTLLKALIGGKKEVNGIIDTAKELAADGSIKRWGDEAVNTVVAIIEQIQLLNQSLGSVSDSFGRMRGNVTFNAGTLSILFSSKSWDEKKQAFSDLNKEATDYFATLDKNRAANQKPIELFGERVKRVRAAAMPDALGFSDIDPKKKKSAKGFINDEDPRDAGAAKVDDYTKIIQSLNEKIAVEQASIDSVGKLGAAEKEHAKYEADLASGAIKMTAAQKSVAAAYWEVYLARQKQKEFADAVDKQTEAMRLQDVALQDQIRSLDKQAEQYGLSERAINSMTESRLEEALAIARSSGADADSIAVLEKELLLRQNLGKAIEGRDTAAILSQTDDAKQKKIDADKALLARKLATGEISSKEYEQGISVIEKSIDGLSEFTKQAARNMQDAMAEFFIDPTAKGMQSIAESFGKAVQKMIAQAVAADLGKRLFGDMGTSGNMGGLAGQGMSWLKGIFGGGAGAAATGTPFSSADLAWLNSPMEAVVWHSGGLVGTGGAPSRMVSASAFIGAQRFHAGGIAGDEVPAILQKGERVLTKEQQKNLMYGGGHRQIVINVNSSTGDPAEIRRSAAAGARTALGFMNGATRYG